MKNTKKESMYTLSIVPSKNVVKRKDGAYSYWKDDNGGRISFFVMLNDSPIKVDINEKNLKIYNEVVGHDLNDQNYLGILEIIMKKNEGLEKYTKIKKISKRYNNKSFQIVFLTEDGRRIFSPKIYVFSKQRKKRPKCVETDLVGSPLKRQRVDNAIKDIMYDEMNDEINALWKMQEKILSQQKEMLQLHRVSVQLQHKNFKLLESIIMTKYDYKSHDEIWTSPEEEEWPSYNFGFP